MSEQHAGEHDSVAALLDDNCRAVIWPVVSEMSTHACEVHRAASALAAVAGLAACGRADGHGMSAVDPDDFASLLGILSDSLRARSTVMERALMQLATPPRQ